MDAVASLKFRILLTYIFFPVFTHDLLRLAVLKWIADEDGGAVTYLYARCCFTSAAICLFEGNGEEHGKEWNEFTEDHQAL